jgi:hypothetical protein
MNELNSKARALVDATQFADEPTAADCERIHAAISARIAVGVAVGTVAVVSAETAAASTVAVPAAKGVVAAGGAAGAIAPALGGAGGGGAAMGVTSGSALAAKVALWVLGIALTGGGVGLLANHELRSQSPLPVAEATSTSSAPHSGVRTEGTASPVLEHSDPSPTPRVVPPEPGDPPSTPHAQTIPSDSKRSPGTRAAAPDPAVAEPKEPLSSTRSTPSTPQLDAELALLRSAHAALVEGHAEEALAALDEHASRFPDGMLAEDRAAQRILALCALGRSDAARDEGLRFVAHHPQSPHVGAVRNSCAFVVGK